MVPSSLPLGPPAFDAVSAYGIGGLAVLMAVLFVRLVTQGQPRTRLPLAGAVAVVMVLSAWAAMSGHLARFDRLPPPMALLMAGVFAAGLGFGCAAPGRRAAETVPLAALIGFQAFRLPLELVMHRAGTLGIMPVELSYSGYNFDIVTGLGAAVIALAMRRGLAVPRAVLWGWNVWGWWCLAVIAGIAMTASPMVRWFGDDPRHLNTWVLHFPYVWLPAVLVTAALAGHVMITRALWHGR